MNSYFNKLNLIFHAIVAFPLAAFVYLYLEIDKNGRKGTIEGTELAQNLIYVLPTIAIVLAGLAFLFYARRLPVVRTIEDFQTKLESYSQLLIQKYIWLEFSAVIAVAGVYLTAEVIYMAIYLFNLLFLSLHRPTVYRIAKDLKLKGQEKDIVVHKKELSENSHTD